MTKPAFNPVFIKELRQLVRSRVIGWLLFAYPVVLFVICSLVLASQRGGQWDDFERAFTEGYGLGTCIATGIILGIAVCLLLPVYAAIKLTFETVENRMGLEFISGLTPQQIVTGKMCATALLMLVLTAVSMPFFTLSYLLRGVGLPVVLLVPALIFVSGLVTLSIGTLIASQRRPVALRIVEVILVLLTGPLITAIVTTINSLVSGHSGTAPADLFGTYLSIAIGVIAAILLCRAVAASMLAPPFIDAIRPVRRTEAVLFLASAPLCFFAPGAWSAVWSAIATLTAVFATRQRLALPRSVAREAPRTVLGRLVSFPFSASYAPGLVFSFLLAVLAAIPAVCSSDCDLWVIPFIYPEVVPFFLVPSLFALKSDSRRAHAVAFGISLVAFIFVQFIPSLHALDIISSETIWGFGCLYYLISADFSHLYPTVASFLSTSSARVAAVYAIVILLIILLPAIRVFGRYRRK